VNPQPQTSHRFTITGIFPGNNKPDVAQALTKLIEKAGGTVAGCAVSNHLEMGGER
jgi:hypothetical protein